MNILIRIFLQICKMVFDMTGVTRDYVDMDVDYDGVEYTGKEVDVKTSVVMIVVVILSRSCWSTWWGT